MTDDETAPFPLLHGTSSHYRHLFTVGQPTVPWPHVTDALSLLQATWKALSTHGVASQWWHERMLGQATGASNWQHGELYAVAGRGKAMDYARSNAAFGGELLTTCAEALERLRTVDRESADALAESRPALAPMLAGGGTPLLVVLRDVPITALAGETATGREPSVDEVIGQLASSAGDPALMAVYGTFGFRVRPGAGTVDGVEELGGA